MPTDQPENIYTVLTLLINNAVAILTALLALVGAVGGLVAAVASWRNGTRQLQSDKVAAIATEKIDSAKTQLEAVSAQVEQVHEKSNGLTKALVEAGALTAEQLGRAGGLEDGRQIGISETNAIRDKQESKP